MDSTLSKKQKKMLKRQQKQKQKNETFIKQNMSLYEDQSNKDNDQEEVNDQKRIQLQASIEKQPQLNVPRKKKDKSQKRKIESSDEAEQQQEDIENGEDAFNFNQVMEGENIQVSFLIAQITEQQYHSMKTILQKFARNTGILSSNWADAIITNKKFGNSVLADDDEQEQDQEQNEDQNQNQPDDQQHVCNGVINILPFKNPHVTSLLNKISQSLKKKKANIFGEQNPSQILSSDSVSLLVCERAINLPATVVKSMHEVLVSDLKQLQKNNKAEYSKVCGKYILGVSEVQIPKNKKDNVDIQQIIFSRFEDYLFLKSSKCWWIGEGSPNSVKKAPLHRLYYLITFEKYLKTVQSIGSLLDE